MSSLRYVVHMKCTVQEERDTLAQCSRVTMTSLNITQLPSFCKMLHSLLDSRMQQSSLA